MTQDLTSRHDLLYVIESNRRAGFYAPAINRYYSNIRVSSVEWTGHQIIFMVKLSLKDKVLYKRYSEWSWPISGNSADYNVKIQVLSDFAIHTVTDGIFQPIFSKFVNAICQCDIWHIFYYNIFLV